ncbi:site-2 protease family protein [Prosthecobacter sp.]|uniref:site-2 protease family protein n=1 Tax=Prosthecobacter sp. TaxID=1965333 RepID=UPI001D7B3B67|nr:site-2 protease family protein [Prosthecobacter sp.]MCB1275316.1 site-2 protease family protein [Prosthecobacter sp.]
MKWSFRLFTFAGTQVRVHITFFLLLLFVASQSFLSGQGVSAALESTLFIITMFACVVLHEFGHVLAARGYGIQTPDITLLPIGGVARLERMPRKPSQEFVVAISGPMVNVIIAAAIWLGLGVTTRVHPGFDFLQSGHFFQKLMAWNIIMVVFNMIPAFPMDGGRVLRAVLAMFMEYSAATRWAASLGQGISILVVIAMLVNGVPFHPMLLLIAFFIFMAAGQEAAMVTQQEATRNLRVRDAMLTDFRSLPPDAKLRDGVELLLAGAQQDFPVLDTHGGMQGMLTRNDLISALAENGPEHAVVEVMRRCPESTQPAIELTRAIESLNSSDCPAIPVIDPLNGELVGLLTAENIGETLMVREALMKLRS